MDFVSFHTHTSDSHADGFGTVAYHLDRQVELGMGTACFTEHGNVNSAVAGEQGCKERGMKFIPGIEAYLGDPTNITKFHITLIAMNEQGWQNLNKIVTQSWYNFKKYPTVTWESLSEYNQGIAVLSGCSDSLFSCTLLGGKTLGPKQETFTEERYDKTRWEIQRFLDIFEDRFYLEVQRFPDLSRTCILNPAFAKLGKQLGVPLIATADVHYPRPEENVMQRTIHAARRGSSVAIIDSEWEYDVLLTYPRSDIEIIEDLEDTGLTNDEAYGAVINTQLLAQQCNVQLTKAKPLRFPVSHGYKDSVHYFKRTIIGGFQYRMESRPDIRDRREEYRRRINLEFKVIKDKDFCDYFLVLSYLITRRKEAGKFIGPARGSAAASLICYLLRITEIDPLFPLFDKMVFERFIDPTRSDMPDVDLDFDAETRQEAAKDAEELYGKGNVANVGNHIKYRGKRSLQDVARAYSLSPKIFEPIAIRCSDRTETDERVDDSIRDVLESYSDNPEIWALLDSYGTALDQACQLEGNKHSMGMHAGGFFIASDPITNVCPIYTRETGQGRKKRKAQVIPYDKRDAEYLNILKMDFLGLDAVGMLTKCCQWTGISVDTLYGMIYKDYIQWKSIQDKIENSIRQGKKVTFTGNSMDLILKLFQDDDVVGLFQYEGGTTRALCKRVQPKDFHELAAVNALSRPGPYYGGQADAYIAVKNGEIDVEPIHPNFDQHVEWTHGQIVYQEQIMWILRDVAGFDVPRVLRVRKIIGKKLGEHQFASLWDEFREGCLSTSNLNEQSATNIWSAITTAAGYAFNIAHAYSYALIAYLQGFFKISHTAQFYASSLYYNGDGKENLPRRTALLQDAITHKIEISKFDPNQSEINWSVGSYYNGPVDKFGMKGDSGRIIPGLSQIDDIGEATASDMVKWRNEASEGLESNYRWGVEWDDFRAVRGIGPATIEKIKRFVNKTDPLGITRTQDQLSTFREQLNCGEFDALGIPCEEEYYTSSTLPDENDYAAFVGFVSNIVYRDEVETIRSRTGLSIEDAKATLDGDTANTKKATLFAYDEFGEVALRASRYMLPKMAGRIGAIKKDHHIVVAWGRTFAGRGNSIQLKNIWIFDPDE